MITALVYMGAVRWHERQEALQEQAREDAMQDGEPFSFQNIPVSLAVPEPEPMSAPVPYKRPLPEIYMGDTPLAPAQQQIQSLDTIHSIMQDFNAEQSLAQFNEELQQVSKGQVNDLEDLSTQNLAQIIQENPEIFEVVQKHLKNPDFQQIISQIFENPQFQQSVQTLQGEPASTTPGQ